MWDGDSVTLRKPTSSKSCSEPTVWDGDSFSCNPIHNLRRRSEPTVWDGDEIKAVKASGILKLATVPSPLGEMETSKEQGPAEGTA